MIVGTPIGVIWSLLGTICSSRNLQFTVTWPSRSNGGIDVIDGKVGRSASRIHLSKGDIFPSHCSAVACVNSRVYTSGDDRYGAAKRGWMNLRGASEANERISAFLAVVRSGIDVSSGGRLVSYWETIYTDTTGRSCIYHQSGRILMVEGRVSSTRSQEKAKIFPSMFVVLVKETARCYMPQRTLTCQGRPSTTTAGERKYSRERDASVSRRYFPSGVMLSSRIS